MTRFAHIILVAFLMATLLGQAAEATHGEGQDMSCCDPEIMQQMHGVESHDMRDCSPEAECPGGDACCAQAIHCIPALVPAADANTTARFDHSQVEMAVIQKPDNAPVARFAPPPIA